MAGNPESDSLRLDDTTVPSRVTPRDTRRKTILNATLLITDVVMLSFAFVFAYYAREILPFFLRPDEQPPLLSYFPTMVLNVGTILVMFFLSRLYHLRRVYSRFDEMRSVIGVVTVGTTLTYGLQALIFQNSALDVGYPRSLFFYVWFFSVIFAGIGREAHRAVRLRLRRNGIAQDNLLIVGEGQIARDITNRIKKRPELGYNIVGVVVKENPKGKMLGFPILGTYPELPALIDAYQVEQVIVAVRDAKRAELVELITLCQRGHVDIKVFPDIFAYMAGDLNVDELGGTPLLTVRDIALRGWKLSLKRGLDVFGSVMGLVFLSPLMLLTALMIKWESKGPVFFSQIRMGLDGNPFPMIKFRSMRPDAEEHGSWTVEDDPRVTRIGSIMRRTNWDEIPQLVNVLMGHMSLVGPRPEQPSYVQQFRESVPRYMERHREKAGMTGWAQVNGLRGDTSIAERTSHDLWYVENWSLWLDIKIIIRTIWNTVLRRNENAY